MREKRTAIQKDIIRLASFLGVVTPKVISYHYDESYKSIRENMIKLEKEGVLKRTCKNKLEFKVQI